MAIVAGEEVVSAQAGTALVKVEEVHKADVEAREVAMEISMEEAVNSNTRISSMVPLPHLSRV